MERALFTHQVVYQGDLKTAEVSALTDAPNTCCVGAIFMPLIFPPFTGLFAWLLPGWCIPLTASQTAATIS